MALSRNTIQRCAWLAGEEIARRQRTGIPIPQALTDLHRELLDEISVDRMRQQWTRESRELSATGHSSTQTGTTPEGLESTADVAQRLGLSQRTVRRHAAHHGAHRVGNRWVFPREEHG